MSNKDYKTLGRDILDHVGGEENVKNVRHCITRLRFNLKDDSIPDTDYLKKLDGVVTVLKSGGQYQVVIGEDVAEVYSAIMADSNLGAEDTNSTEENRENDDRNLLNKFIDFISGIFQPFLMALAATGMIKGLVAILGAFGLNGDNSGLYFILNAAGDGFFQFLPVMVAVTAARKLKMNEFTALAVAVAFLHPTLRAVADREVLYTLFQGSSFESPIHLTFFEIPVIMPNGGYYSSIVPIIAAVWFGSRVEKWMKKVIPRVVNSFLTPFFTVLITVPVALIILGPIANFAAALVGVFFTSVYDFSPIIFGALLGAGWQVLVIFGLHWGIVPIHYLLLAEQGFSPIAGAYILSTFGVLGVLLAMIIKTKEKKVKDIAIPSAISAFFGISEPSIYGLLLPMKKPFLYAISANAVAGAFAGGMGIDAYRTGGLGIFSMLNFIENDGSLSMNFWGIVIAFSIATVLGFVLQMIFPLPQLEESKEETTSKGLVSEDTVSVNEMRESAREDIIATPVSGKAIPLSETPDEVFSSGALGNGITIDPAEGVVRAPANGTITALFETGHAIGLTTDLGTELLIHIGIDTVEMEGKGFTKLVEKNQKVSAGQELLRFDIDTIRKHGYSPVIPIIVTNTAEYTDVLLSDEEIVQSGDYLLTALK